ncbi:ABC transporter permease [Acinetobacter puyangensis]|uniref:Sulfonate transport system permease protein n=1 Tax=Acinetobacter puyangensis TaxID=1096779 RepID=A0A240EBU0_9GAMM|nr:ABC transporter permease [Acinetobacter puyangensis]SNX46177.1 sulfonate transport system permease protein [Acinetobacter puyangensis]
MKRYLLPLVVLVLWQLGASTGVVDLRLFSSPERIALKFGESIADGSLIESILISLSRSFSGLFVGLLAGVALGVANGLWRASEETFDSSIQILRNIPVIALTSLFIVWFGYGELSKILLIAMACFFPTYINVFAGIRNADNRLIEMAKTMNVKRRVIVRHILLPAALPQALVGLRFALTVSIFALFVAETINTSSGIGFLMMQGQQFGQSDIIFMCLIIYALFGVASDLLVRFLEQRLLSWRQEFKGN